MADAPDSASRVPAWKKLGLKLKYANDETPSADAPIPDPTSASKKRSRDEPHVAGSGANQSDDKPSETPSKRSKKRKLEQAGAAGEIEQSGSTPDKAPKRDKKEKKDKKREQKSADKTALPDRTTAAPENPGSQEKAAALSTPVRTLKRKKSVSFTPDTKKSDGDSGQQLFKAWAKGQTASSSEDSIVPSTESSAIEDDEPADEPSNISKKDLKKAKKEQRNAARVATQSTKEDKGLPPYVTYLDQYHSDRDGWKFNKKHQVDLLKNLFNLYRVPASYDPAVEAYIAGLKGANARYVLKERAQTALAETAADMSMDSPANRKAAADASLQKQINAAQKRYRESDEYQQHEHKRRRAELVLQALGHVEEPPTAAANKKAAPQKQPEAQQFEDAGNKKRSRPRKSRTQDFSSSEEDSSSDESSVVSSSSEDPSSDSDSDSNSSSDSGSDSGSDENEASNDDGSESEVENINKKTSVKTKKQQDESEDSDSSGSE
ncbi:hypothetical protein MPH_10454 [Macrophomina phaseolina MS6]|uniref:WKF domain-containing protein n=1 Tax=Macrophomina phaseolina (strain MS6) TaxID=1126212 RepID=K2RHG4_MACPH|nr:hypothetical protein MPH_10454 [Macrophomina phaseolina MS6]